MLILEKYCSAKRFLGDVFRRGVRILFAVKQAILDLEQFMTEIGTFTQKTDNTVSRYRHLSAVEQIFVEHWGDKL